MKNILIQKRRMVGEIMVKQGRITPEQLTRFLRTQKETGKLLGQVLIEEEILNQEELTRILMGTTWDSTCMAAQRFDRRQDRESFTER